MDNLKQEIYNMQVETESKIKQIKEEQKIKEQEVLEIFREKFKDIIIKYNNRYFKGIEFATGYNNSLVLQAYQILNIYGEINKKDHSTKAYIWESQFSKECEIVTLNDIKDNSFNFENKTLADLKAYLEGNRIDIKNILMNEEGSFLDFKFNSVDGILSIYKSIIKGNCKKFSTFYNLIKKMEYNNYKIKKTMYGYNSCKLEEVYKITCDTLHNKELRFFKK